MNRIFFRFFFLLSFFYISILVLLWFFYNKIIFLLFSFMIYSIVVFGLYRMSLKITSELQYVIRALETFPELEKLSVFRPSFPEIQDLVIVFKHFLERYSHNLNELNLEKSLLNSLLNNLKEGVICLHQNGKIIYMNNFVRKKFGKIRSEKCFSEQPYFEMISNPTLLDIIYKIVYKKETSYVFSGSIMGKDFYEFREGGKFYQVKFYEIELDTLDVCYNNYKHENSHLQKKELLFLFIISDITEEYNIKRMREDFLQNASHELKTPITSIRGYAETLIDRVNINHSLYIQFLEGILRNAERMERIINDMVLISSLEVKSYPFYPKKVEIRNFLRELSIMVEGMLKPKNLSLDYYVDSDIDCIYADPLLLEHLFLNLISNAVRYSFKGEKIEIFIRKEKKQKILIQVKDRGPGIPDEYKYKIFERFFRIDKDRSRKEGGTGLGLSIVRQIVKIHKGNIIVKDNPDGGTIFEISLAI